MAANLPLTVFDFGTIVALGVVASGFFWRILSRLERKVDQIVEHMVNKADCMARHQSMESQFKRHYHIPDDGVGVIQE